MKSTAFPRVGFALVAGFLLVLPAAIFGQAASARTEKIPLIQFESVPLDMAIENLAQQAELNFVVGATLPRQSVSLRKENITAAAVLTNLLAEHRLFMIESPATGVALILTTNRIQSPMDSKWITADTNSALPLIQFSMAPLSVAVESLAKHASPGMVVDLPRSDVMVSIRWKNLKPRQAIAALCEAYNLSLAIDPKTAAARISAK